MTLHRYFAMKFLRSFLALFAAFAIFLWLVDLLEHIRRFDAGEVGLAQLAYMAALHLPELLYETLNLIVLLTAITVFVSLSRSNELVIARAAGRSALRSMIAPVIAGALVAGTMVAIGNPVVAAVSKEYRAEENRLRGSERVVSVGREGLWLRQGDGNQQTAIHAEAANADGTELFDVTFFGFDAEDNALWRVDGAEAVLGRGVWVVTGAKRWSFEANLNPERDAEVRETLFVPTDLTRDQIRDSFGTPSAIPIWDLPGFIDTLEAAGFSARSHRVWFQSELSKPLVFVAMVLIGAVFTSGHFRSARSGLMVLTAVLAGFGVHFVGNLARVMGDSGQLPVGVAVWAAPTAALCLALAMILHLEDG